MKLQSLDKKVVEWHQHYQPELLSLTVERVRSDFP